MLRDILYFSILPAKPEPIATIEYTDARLDMLIRALVFDGGIKFGKAFLTIQPTHQFILKTWLPVDCDDSAFEIDTDELIGIVMIES